jgi:CRISPR-associated protein Cas2
MFVILVYDANEKRVQKFHKICKKYLTHVQNSVFEGEITDTDLRKLTDELREVLEETEDSVLIYKFRTRKYFERESIGIEKPSSDEFIV